MKKYLSKSLLILQQLWKNYQVYNEYFIHEHCFHLPNADKSLDLISKHHRTKATY